MEGLVVLDPETDKPGGNKVKGEKVVKGSVVAGGRKKLADISNLQRNQDNPQLSVSVDSKEYIIKIQKENMALVKLLAERNKIIELSGIELQKLRISIQRLQQQNKQLAQANSQMLGELNSAKDRLKILQHELGCAKTSNVVETTGCDKLVGCIKEKMENSKPIGKHKSKLQALGSTAINQVQAQEKVDKKRSSSRRQSARFSSADQELTQELLETSNSVEPSTASEHDQEKVESKRSSSRRQSARFISADQELTQELLETSNSLEPSTASEHDQEKVESKRSSSRRQSARFRCSDRELTEDLLETSNSLEPSRANSEHDQEKVGSKRLSLRRQSAQLKSQQLVEEAVEESHTNDAKFPVSSSDGVLSESCPPQILLLKDEPEAPKVEPEYEAEELRRSSIRPKRRAVEKIQSYKELSINMKMRRFK